HPSDPGRLEGIRYASVRLLPVRNDHECARPAAAAPQPFRRRYQRRGDERLPLRQLPPCPAGYPLGRRPDEVRETTMSETRSASAIARSLKKRRASARARSLKEGISGINGREFLAMV